MSSYNSKKHMTKSDYLRHFTERWGGVCILCGEPFLNIDSITKEHLQPRSRVRGVIPFNVAPSHWHCNKLRGVLSLMEAVHLLERKKRILGRQFESWANAAVPHRYKGHPAEVQCSQEFLEAFEVYMEGEEILAA